MSYLTRVYRHRNPKREQQHHGRSFFAHAGGSIQTKRETSFFQTKLEVNEPGDRFEQEADHVANNVVNNTEQSSGQLQRKKITGIQRLSTSKKDDDLTSTDEERMKRDKDIQRMTMPEDERKKMKGGGSMQRKQEGNGGGTATPVLASRVENSAGKGRKISGGTLSHMQSAFGQDFSDVSIHADQQSAEMNKELNAQAFTHGRDIYFNAGKYDPESTQGKKLLAHELTHVVQQTGSKTQD